MIAPRARHQEVLERMTEKINSVPYRDPADPQTILGPVATAGQRDRVESYLRIGRDEGARLVLGGGIDLIPGYQLIKSIPRG